MKDKILLLKQTLKQAKNLKKKIKSDTEIMEETIKQCVADELVLKTAGKKAFEQNTFEPEEVVGRFWPYPADVKS